MKKVYFVILNYNDGELTSEYANEISKFETVDHIVVVDNCSNDDSLETIKNKTGNNHKIVCIKTDSNGGYARGNNFGVSYIASHFDAMNSIVVISNPDIKIDEDSLKKIVESFSDSEQFAATGIVHNATGKVIPIFTWKTKTIGSIFLDSSVLLRNLFFKAFKIGSKVSKDLLDFNKQKICCDNLPGCFFAFDLSKWEKIGGFSDNTFLFYEEDILFFKAKSMGYKVYLIPSSTILHLEGVSIKKSLNSWKKREKLLEKSCITYMKECLNASALTIKLYTVWNSFWMLERYCFYKLMNQKS